MTTFGTLLKEKRLARGMTQKMLADAVNVNGSYIARLESDERHASRRVVLDIARALELTPQEADQLLALAQHLPEGDLARLIAHTGVPFDQPAIKAVTHALQDPGLSPHGRQQLETEIIAYVQFRSREIKREEHAR